MCIAISHKNLQCSLHGLGKLQKMGGLHLKNSSPEIRPCDRDDLFFQDILGDIRTDQSTSFGANFIIMDLRPSTEPQTTFYDLKESLCII